MSADDMKILYFQLLNDVSVDDALVGMQEMGLECLQIEDRFWIFNRKDRDVLWMYFVDGKVNGFSICKSYSGVTIPIIADQMGFDFGKVKILRIPNMPAEEELLLSKSIFSDRCLFG